MAVFISVTTDAFATIFDEQLSQQPDYEFVRRPFRGLEIKKETYAIIRVVNSAGVPLEFFDSSAPPSSEESRIGKSTSYANFFLESVQEARDEKMQLVETFGDNYVFFMGERPRVLQFRGSLVNSNDFNWEAEWWYNYDNLFRGTKLVENNARMYIYYDDNVVEGYMLQASAQKQSTMPMHVPLTFSLFVTNYANVSQIGSVIIPDRPAIDNSAALTASSEAIATLQSYNAGVAESVIGREAASANSLNAFLARVARYRNDATFSVQRSLENFRNLFLNTQLSVTALSSPGASVIQSAIENRAEAPAGASTRGVPIYNNRDEYVQNRDHTYEPRFDEAELRRVNEEKQRRTPAQLAEQVRNHLHELGINTDDRYSQAMLLGRNLGQTAANDISYAAFGMRRAIQEGESVDWTGADASAELQRAIPR